MSDFSPLAGVSTVYPRQATETDTGSFALAATNQGIDEGVSSVTSSDSSDSSGGGGGGGSCFISTAMNSLGW